MVLAKIIKIDRICDVMLWTSSSKQSLNIQCLGKYLSESLKTLGAETTRQYGKIFEKKKVATPLMEFTRRSNHLSESIGILGLEGER